MLQIKKKLHLVIMFITHFIQVRLHQISAVKNLELQVMIYLQLTNFILYRLHNTSHIKIQYIFDNNVGQHLIIQKM
jgi:hypothetical protein